MFLLLILDQFPTMLKVLFLTLNISLAVAHKLLFFLIFKVSKFSYGS